MAFSPSPSPAVSTEPSALPDAPGQLVLLTRSQAEQGLATGWLHTLGQEQIVTQDTNALLRALLAAAESGDEVLLQLDPSYQALRCGELHRGEGRAPLPLQWAWALPLVLLVQAGNRVLRRSLV